MKSRFYFILVMDIILLLTFFVNQSVVNLQLLKS